eukprot:283829-Chlamydomonas_euryale.AAC.2
MTACVLSHLPLTSLLFTRYSRRRHRPSLSCPAPPPGNTLTCRDACAILCEHIELYRATAAAVSHDQLSAMPAAARERALRSELRASGNLHPALHAPGGSYAYLRGLSAALLQRLLPPHAARADDGGGGGGAVMVCDAVGGPLVRELVASCVLRPLVMLALPHSINRHLLRLLAPDELPGPAAKLAAASGGGGSVDGAEQRLLVQGQQRLEARSQRSVRAERDALLALSRRRERGDAHEKAPVSLPTPRTPCTPPPRPAQPGGMCGGTSGAPRGRVTARQRSGLPSSASSGGLFAGAFASLSGATAVTSGSVTGSRGVGKRSDGGAGSGAAEAVQTEPGEVPRVGRPACVLRTARSVSAEGVRAPRDASLSGNAALNEAEGRGAAPCQDCAPPAAVPAALPPRCVRVSGVSGGRGDGGAGRGCTDARAAWEGHAAGLPAERSQPAAYSQCPAQGPRTHPPTPQSPVSRGGGGDGGGGEGSGGEGGGGEGDGAFPSEVAGSPARARSSASASTAASSAAARPPPDQASFVGYPRAEVVAAELHSEGGFAGTTRDFVAYKGAAGSAGWQRAGVRGGEVERGQGLWEG